MLFRVSFFFRNLIILGLGMIRFVNCYTDFLKVVEKRSIWYLEGKVLEERREEGYYLIVILSFFLEEVFRKYFIFIVISCFIYLF